MESSGDMNPPPASRHQQVEAASPISSRPPSDSGADEVSGNRWPRQETLALLKIRSEMDATFRDANLKGPLWEHVSRKLLEMGYKRSGKKCKEKFENVHKYYRRTKEGGATRHHPKTYTFFSELEALQATSTSTASPPPPQNPIPVTSPPPSSLPIPLNSTSPTPGEEEYGRKRKRGSNEGIASCFSSTTDRMMEMLEGKMKTVLEKQEAMQQRFLEALEKREQERTIREEAWRRQETAARLAREHHLLAQERALSASRLISLLEKITGQTIPFPPDQPTQQPKQVAMAEEEAVMEASSLPSSRWPREEVVELIKVRSGMEGRYEEGAKGKLWEQVSTTMEKKGYKRSPKRCKEKWENINKYFKRVKESSKKRPEDAKTCPYFHQLDALYRKKAMLPQDHDNIVTNKLMVEGYDPDMINEGEEEDEDDAERNKMEYKIEFQRPLDVVPPISNAGAEAGPSFLAMPMVQ